MVSEAQKRYRKSFLGREAQRRYRRKRMAKIKLVRKVIHEGILRTPNENVQHGGR